MGILDRFTMWLFKGAIQKNRKFRVAAHKAMLDYFGSEYREDTPITKLYIASAELLEASQQDEIIRGLCRNAPAMVQLGIRQEIEDAIEGIAIPVD